MRKTDEMLKEYRESRIELVAQSCQMYGKMIKDFSATSPNVTVLLYLSDTLDI